MRKEEDQALWPFMEDTRPMYMKFVLPVNLYGYRRDIQRFFYGMLYKLHKNAHKGGWKDGTVDKYIELLRGEMDELEEAIRTGNVVHILDEACDVANFALMIASVAINGESDVHLGPGSSSGEER